MLSDNIFAAIIVLSNLFFGAASVIILPWGIIHAAKSSQSRIAISLLYTGIIAMCYFLARAGVVADERGIGGNQVEPFFGTEWYFLLALTIAAVAFQASLITKRKEN